MSTCFFQLVGPVTLAMEDAEEKYGGYPSGRGLTSKMPPFAQRSVLTYSQELRKRSNRANSLAESHLINMEMLNIQS